MDKQLSLEALTASLKPGMQIAFGGGGIQRKPMAAARAIARSQVAGLDLVSFLGGPEIDLLIGLGRASRLSFAFVGFDAYGLAPCFRAAREAGSLPIVEYSEATMLAAFEAGAKNLPFLPTRFGLGTDIVTTPTSPFKTFPCPFTGETLLGVPALTPDLALVHVNVADRSGNAIIHSDAYADTLMVRASKRVVLTAERVVDELPTDQTRRSTFISRLWVDGVIEAPGGAGMTAMFPDYRFDVPKVLEYQKNAAKREWLEHMIQEATA
ncbi:MAG: CoA-transferase [Pseudomonadota bacterium]